VIGNVVLWMPINYLENQTLGVIDGYQCCPKTEELLVIVADPVIASIGTSVISIHWFAYI
jgi:hypothetical protein